MLNSVEKDGTGFGLDLITMERVAKICSLPLIVMGGAGQYGHFAEVYSNGIADAISTANILNFIGDAIPDVRKLLLKNGFDLALFSTNNLSIIVMNDVVKHDKSYELIGARLSMRDTLESAVEGYYNIKLY